MKIPDEISILSFKKQDTVKPEIAYLGDSDDAGVLFLLMAAITRIAVDREIPENKMVDLLKESMQSVKWVQ